MTDEDQEALKRQVQNLAVLVTLLMRHQHNPHTGEVLMTATQIGFQATPPVAPAPPAEPVT